MRRLAFSITLRDDCIFSSSSASAGESRSRDYLPGAVLRGIAAQKLYAALQRDDLAFDVFHAGKVRFGDGLPLSAEGAIAYPTPLSFHTKKDAPDAGPDLPVTNRALALFPRNDQPEQVRGGYVTLDGVQVAVSQRARLRAGVDPASGRAAERALFAYSGLVAGSRFVAEVEIDDAMPATVDSRIVEALTGSLRLGRSRSAEYGRAESVAIEIPSNIPTATSPATDSDSQSVSLVWFLSDTRLTDEFGQPTLRPKPAHFGIVAAGAKIDFDKSFMRFRRVSAYNAALGMNEAEREYVERGSVIAIVLPTGADRQAGCRYIGAECGSGYGRVVVDADFVHVTHPTLRKVAIVETENTPSPPDLIAWAASSLPTRIDEAELWARTARASARELYQTARAYDGIDITGEIGPTRAQWGRILSLAKRPRASSFETFRAEIFEVAKAHDDLWARRGIFNGLPTSFRDWLAERLTEVEAKPDAVLRIGLLAREVSQVLADEDRGGAAR